jgi:prepilin-type N-terminal cleavage/methylation domain-containing protein
MTRSQRHLARLRRRDAHRRGMTLIEVILAVVILSGAMLGLANFGRKFQHTVSTTSDTVLASDLATQRIEQIKGYRVYTTLAATFNGVTETFTDATYNGFIRKTKAVRTQTVTTPMYDYITVTVTAGRDTVTAAAKKTTIIALF